MRLSQETIRTIPWYLKPFFWNQKRKYGAYLEPARVWAVIPRLFIAVASVYGVLDRKKSPLSPELRSLISVRVAQMNGCRFCVDMNSALFVKRAHTNAKIQALAQWRESSLLTDLEKAALHYAEQMTQVNQEIDDECFNHLRHYFDEKTMIELTALIAFQNMSSKFNSALGIAPQGFCNKPTEQ
ncbi:carboxymuconolactone decarboxylase family protein [Legionella oakridgensis]|uniref:Alkylhydroperoxidase AhpD family core domain protein n=2 Tax=Legionella oakridgensis TaxID=29423 RepID=W0BHK4_9GAMM|nr:carboxymuconolactone decarboxylase family protein [Legionella oakridgensis]AHE68112.1 alkylhydroperoxidase AhpD family core domain protein [Legionella oakridgensis ATCC 33761 = DSM 21215]KTD42539.1 putative Carboxymuconolactone decarboxylase [Legionella oakridgensis]STY21086.1 putative Carboxymuconolactone decarboxylase [Legionella longbeachae]